MFSGVSIISYPYHCRFLGFCENGQSKITLLQHETQEIQNKNELNQ